MMQLGVGKWAHIALGSLMILIIYMFYRFLNHRMLTSKIINIMFAFILAGALCSLVDKVFWDGSLDYIMLNGFFTFDLKDLYINFSIGILTVLIITKNKVLEKFDDKDIVKDFAKYIIQIARKS
jgi:signal peptidase II